MCWFPLSLSLTALTADRQIDFNNLKNYVGRLLLPLKMLVINEHYYSIMGLRW